MAGLDVQDCRVGCLKMVSIMNIEVNRSSFGVLLVSLHVPWHESQSSRKSRGSPGAASCHFDWDFQKLGVIIVRKLPRVRVFVLKRTNKLNCAHTGKSRPQKNRSGGFCITSLLDSVINGIAQRYVTFSNVEERLIKAPDGDIEDVLEMDGASFSRVAVWTSLRH